MITLFVGSALAATNEKKSFSIPAGPADKALKAFSDQSGLEVVYPGEIVRGVRATAVQGEMSPAEAVARLLTGTGLTGVQDAKTGAFSISRENVPNGQRAAQTPESDRPNQNRAGAAASKGRAERPASAAAEETVILTPFEVSASSDVGYEATETLAGSRLNTALKDIATQINVMTPEFLQDLAITNLDDAIRYSLNTETRDEIEDVDAPNTLGNSETTAVVGASSGRTRSLAAPNNSHDFFDTFVRLDTYNSERFTFASGPNSILFGNSSPSGTIDTTFKRANPSRRFFEVSSRANFTTGSVRLATDLNQPIVRKILGLRVAGLGDRDKSWRKPGFYNRDRVYAALTFTPFKSVSVRAYNENARFNQHPVKNTLVQDHVTPWIQEGRPLFNNALNATLLTGATNPRLPSSLRRPNGPTRPIIFYDSTGLQPGAFGPQPNTALSQGYDTMTPAPNNFERSITDESIFPYDVNYSGDLAQARFRSWVRGGILEFNPFPRFFVEAGFNQEQIRNRGIDFLDNRQQELIADPNLYLNDRVTPNPNVGRFYFENAFGGVNNLARKEFGAKEQKRVSFSYELNFEERGNWLKWLGRHRAALLLDRAESTRIAEQSLLSVVGTDNFFFVPGNANSRQSGFRYYIDPQNMSIKLPFDLNVDGVITQPGWVDPSGRQVLLASFDPLAGASNLQATRTRVDSTAFVTQSYFLRGRLVLSYGRREDGVDIQQAPGLAPHWDFDGLINGHIPWTTVKDETPVNTVKSAVVHPFNWVSLSYSETTSQQVRTEVVRNLTGSIAKLGTGSGKDYGITLRWRNLISVRLNKYENADAGSLSALRNATPTPAVFGFGPNVKATVAQLERAVQMSSPNFDPANPSRIDPALLSPTYAHYQQALADLIPQGQAIGPSIGGTYDVISDRVAKGHELTIIGNPTPNWRIAVTGSKNTAAESNIGLQYLDFIKERLPVWSSDQYIDKILPQSAGGNQVSIRQALAVAMLNWNYIRLSDGRLSNRQRKYRFTATTRYAFSQGRLRGTFMGGNYSWRSPAAVGYRKIDISDNPFLAPGVAENTVTVDDLDNPIRGGPLTTFDVFLGHSRRLAVGKFNWRIQLNIRNALNDRRLIVQKALTTGEGAIFTVQEPRTFILTNTFTF